MLGTFSSPSTIKHEDTSSSQPRLMGGYSNSTKRLQPIKNQDGTYKEEKSKGVFVEPVDISLNGRDSADIIIKEDEVLIRAGKNIKTQTAGFNLPTPRQSRSFLQLSSFSLERKELDPLKQTLFSSKSQLVKKLIEWEITNEFQTTGPTPGGGITATTVYNGNIKLYSLLPKDQTKSTEVNMNTPLDAFKSGPEYTLEFTSKTKDDSIKLINQFIGGVNKGKITMVISPSNSLRVA